MTWDKAKPANNSKIRDLGTNIRPNWEAIETADTSLQQDGVNLKKQSSDLGGLAENFRLYSKVANGNTELFGQNSAGGTGVQLTRGKPTVGASGHTFLPGGLILSWGSGSYTNSSEITATGISTIYQVVISIQDSSATPGSRAYVTNINTPSNGKFKVNIQTSGSGNLRWIAIGI